MAEPRGRNAGAKPHLLRQAGAGYSWSFLLKDSPWMHSQKLIVCITTLVSLEDHEPSLFPNLLTCPLTCLQIRVFNRRLLPSVLFVQAVYWTDMASQTPLFNSPTGPWLDRGTIWKRERLSGSNPKPNHASYGGFLKWGYPELSKIRPF